MFILKENAIKAYKAMSWEYTCYANFKYEVGRTYSMPGSWVDMCVRGFHCCRNLADCYTFYDCDGRTRICEVEVWGIVFEDKDQVFQNGAKLCANNIKIIRELSLDEIYKKLKTRNFGPYNFGAYNTGSYNIGNYNTGSYNVGNSNSGNYNIGHGNSGGGNKGDRNIGDNNVGSRNVGDFNVGSDNRGSFNRSDNNIGHFNLKYHDGLYCFDKPCTSATTMFQIPYFLYMAPSIEPISGIHEVYTKESTKDRDLSHYAHIDIEPKSAREAIHTSFEYNKKVNKYYVLNGCKYLTEHPCFDYGIFEEITGITKDEIEEVINE